MGFMWAFLTLLGVLTLVGAVALVVLGVRGLRAKKTEEGAAFLVIAAVFLLQACFFLVAFLLFSVRAGANPWG